VTRFMDDKVRQGVEIVDSATRQGATARLLGGIAVAVRCPSASAPPFARAYSDFDFATTRGNGPVLTAVLAPFGFQPADRFNAINGHSRLLFTNSEGMHVDVFVDDFRMCHELSLHKRIAVDEVTLPLAELLLTKAQVADLTEKDIQDISVMLLDCELRDDDSGINTRYIADILGHDWGFWRTVTENLGHVRTRLETLVIDAEQRSRIVSALDDLTQTIEARPKSVRWRARARLGDRVSWREEPEGARR
jgi:hypothetical protein